MQINPQFMPRIGTTPLTGTPASSPAQGNQPQISFDELLRQQLQQTSSENVSGLNFSKHAFRRMGERGIEMSAQTISQMDSAVEMAAQKGIQDALMLSGSTAFIVNVPSKTVVTAMDSGEMKNQVITNIDGTVFF